MARPRKEKEKRRTHRLPHVRCTESEGERIRKNALASNMTVSDYLRFMALNGGVLSANDNQAEQASNSFDDKLIWELHRIGNNLNQLTKKFHSKGVEPHGLRPLFPVLEKLLTRVFKHINVD